MTVFVDENRQEFGVEPICAELPNCLVYLLRAQTPGAGTAAVFYPVPPRRGVAAADSAGVGVQFRGVVRRPEGMAAAAS